MVCLDLGSTVENVDQKVKVKGQSVLLSFVKMLHRSDTNLNNAGQWQLIYSLYIVLILGSVLCMCLCIV